MIQVFFATFVDHGKKVVPGTASVELKVNAYYTVVNISINMFMRMYASIVTLGECRTRMQWCVKPCSRSIRQ